MLEAARVFFRAVRLFLFCEFPAHLLCGASFYEPMKTGINPM